MTEWKPKPPRPAPASSVGFAAWARHNLFATPGDVALRFWVQFHYLVG